MRFWLTLLTLTCATSVSVGHAADKILVGPETEDRFPPLKIPDGFKATLFACDPLVEYPSVIALGPRVGTLLVAHDYMTGLGVEIVRRDEVRLIEDTDGDGYADKSTVFADGFNSIQGLEFYNDTVFVMHAPLLTSVRDTDGDGVADERRDLLNGLGLPPEQNSNRLHCANGVVAGHDGWLYLALGDRGCDVKRPEGDRLVFQQGGILRCRRDGSDLHVFSTGLRNIYDVALDDELNVFVRDNENDGGDYMIRVCHCFFGSDHGYPYHYYERPEEPMMPMADLGRGSSAGGVCYNGAKFPEEYQGNLFFCEWGRAVVRYPRERKKGGFAPTHEIDFAAAANDDPYGLKPTDLVVDYDGSLLISDWGDGQRPKRGRGRIYRITAETRDRLNVVGAPKDGRFSASYHLKVMQSPRPHERITAQRVLEEHSAEMLPVLKKQLAKGSINVVGRLHAVWLLAGQDNAVEELFALASHDPAPRVRAQAVRAIGDLTDPVLVEDKINAGRGDHKIAERLAELGENADPRVALEVLIVLRRLRWCQIPDWIAEHLPGEEPALDHAAQQALRNASNWPGVMRLLDESPRLRKLALQAMAEQRVSYLATQLIKRLKASESAAHRRDYIDSLARIVRQEKPWTYWGFRPAPRPAASVDWEQTPAIITALNRSLADDSLDVRALTLKRMQREGVRPELMRLAAWLREENDQARTAQILTALKLGNASETRQIFREAALRRSLPTANRLSALSNLLTNLPVNQESSLIDLAKRLEDGPVLAAMLTAFGSLQKVNANEMLFSKLDSSSPGVRAAAIRSLAQRKAQARKRVTKLIDDEDIGVQQAAAEAAGLLNATDAAGKLLALSKHDDKQLVRASLNSLRLLKDARAVDSAVKALDDRVAQLSAMRYLREHGSPKIADRIQQAAATNLSLEFQQEAIKTLVAWVDRFPAADLCGPLATIQGHSGHVLLWGVFGPLSEDELDRFERWRVSRTTQIMCGPFANDGFPLAGDEEMERIGQVGAGQVQLDNPSGEAATWIAASVVEVRSETNIEVLASASGSTKVWVADKLVHTQPDSVAFRVDSHQFPAKLRKGKNYVFVKITSSDKAPRFHLRFRRRSTKAEHEQLIKFALQSRGNAGRGRDVFKNVKKSSCLQCHRLGEKGGKIGPDLAGIGRRFSRIHLIESILEPSRTIAPSYATISVALNDGRVLTGVRVAQSEELITVGDNQGKLHEIPRGDIEEISSPKVSTMPEGLEKKLTDREFVDLVAFLESQKTNPQ